MALTHRHLVEKDFIALHRLYIAAEMEYVPHDLDTFLAYAGMFHYYGGFIGNKLVSVVDFVQDTRYPNSLGCGIACLPNYSRRCWSKGMFRQAFKFGFAVPSIDYLWAETDDKRVEKILKILGFNRLSSDPEGLHLYTIQKKAVLPRLR